MKITKRVLALVVAMLMIVSTCAVAASAATTLQAQIDAAAVGGVVTLTGNVIGESITIAKDLTLDLGGKTLEGAPGKTAITVLNDAKVTITNGYINSRFANVDSWTMLETVTSQSPNGIRVIGGEITLDGVRVVGSFTRIPTTVDNIIPTGTALAISHGAKATIKQTVLYGDYAINNRVSGSPDAGEIVVYDSILAGFIAAIKGSEASVSIAEGYQLYNMKDYAAGALDPQITLEDGELEMVDMILADRILFSLKDVDEKADVTVDGATATVQAAEISHLWKNQTSTDCSYKYVPVAAVLADGSEVTLDSTYSAVIDAADAEDVTIKYCAYFDMMPDVGHIIKNYEFYVQDSIDKAIGAVDEAYEGYVDTYNEYVTLLANGNYTIARAAQDFQTQFGVDISDVLFDVRLALLKIGGKTMFDPKYVTDAEGDDTYFGWGLGTWYYYYCEHGTKQIADYPGDDANFGVLDILEGLNAEVANYMPFSNKDNWGDFFTFIADNYQVLIDAIPEAQAAIADLKAALADEDIADLLEYAGMSEYVAIVDELDAYATEAADAINYVLNDADVKAVLQEVQYSKKYIPEYAEKLADVCDNFTTYVPMQYIITGNYLRTVFMEGETEVTYIAQPTNVDITIDGPEGTVAYTGTEPGSTVDSIEDVVFNKTISMTATPGEDVEFLYWVNTETDRIISTNATLELASSIDRKVTAVFGYADEAQYVFCNPTGDIYGYGYDTGDGIEYDIDTPEVEHFQYDGFIGDSGKTGLINADTVASLTAETKPTWMAYPDGNTSAFSSANTIYDGNGYIVPVNPASASFIFTPCYSVSGTQFWLTATKSGASTPFIDKAYAYGTVVKLSDTAANFSYWTDGEGRIVSVRPTYNYQVVSDAALTAVAGADEVPAAVVNIRTVETSGEKLAFIVERSAADSVKVLASGIVINYSATEIPTVKAADIKGTAKLIDNEGIYTANLAKAKINANGGKVVARAYLEIEGVGVIYSDAYYFG